MRIFYYLNLVAILCGSQGTGSKAKKYGMGMVGARNSTHYGIVGYYPLMACKENMIGITGTNARQD